MKTLVSILLISLCFNYSYLQECPKPKVQKRTIIRSAASIENGAKLLYKLTVSSARECYQECCSKDDCNVAVMHYKQDDYTDEMKKFCFLFDCGSPENSLCTFDAHSRYAVIEIPKIRVELKTTELPTVGDIVDKPTTLGINPTTGAHHHEVCPPGAPTAMCSDNPCDKKTCASHKDVICKPSFCGGCYAKFYNKQGKEVKCTEPAQKAKNEEVVNVASTDYGETPIDELPGPAKLVAQPTNDPYFQSERRKWPEGREPGHLTNATIPKDHADKNKNPDENQPPQKKVIVVNNTFMSVPLFIALCICILLILGLIYRFKCSARGKPKKFPVDDGDYLINGMYL